RVQYIGLKRTNYPSPSQGNSMINQPATSPRIARCRLCLAAVLVIVGISLGTAAVAQEGVKAETWAFTHPPDSYKADAMLDLRYLNEKEAGMSGFVKLSPDSNSFALGNGKPVRFWAVVSDAYRLSPEDMARHARFLAKLGVNMVRLH